WDIHGSYGHLYVQVNEPAIAPLGEAKPNTEIFRLLARRMGFEPELFEATDQELIVEAIAAPASSRRFPPPAPFARIDFPRLRPATASPASTSPGSARKAQFASTCREALPRSPRAASTRLRASASSIARRWRRAAWIPCRRTRHPTKTRKPGQTWPTDFRYSW